MRQKIRLTFEKLETFRIQNGRQTISEYCPRCCNVVEMISPDMLAKLTGSSEREIFRLVESGHVYFVESERIYACTHCFESSVTNVKEKKSNGHQI